MIFCKLQANYYRSVIDIYLSIAIEPRGVSGRSIDSSVFTSGSTVEIRRKQRCHSGRAVPSGSAVLPLPRDQAIINPCWFIFRKVYWYSSERKFNENYTIHLVGLKINQLQRYSNLLKTNVLITVTCSIHHVYCVIWSMCLMWSQVTCVSANWRQGTWNIVTT